MTAAIASMLLIGLLVSFFGKSFEIRGWTEVREPNDQFYRGLAEFAYMNSMDHSHHDDANFSYLVTQARWKNMHRAGILYNIGFIVMLEQALHEKCIVLIKVRPVQLLGGRRSVLKFWCRRVA
ncbi:hypothetical protein MTO96_015265 [Rhipicephalus appendiculatus]